jgi:molybdopterin-guanine dinucleotide biosynthesis protein A
MLTGVILAGGKNSRMGGFNKALLSFFNESLIQRQIRRMHPICSELIVVTNDPDAFQIIAGDTIRIITDEITGKGPLSGMHAAFSFSSNSDLWVVGCDMPFISASAAKYLWEYKNANSLDAVIPTIEHRDQPLHGVYSKSSLSIITNLLNHGEYRLNQLLSAIRYKSVQESTFLELGVDLKFIMNVNTPQQYEEALRQCGCEKL